MAKPTKRGLLEQSIPLPAGQGYPQSPGPDAGMGGTVNSLSYGIGTGMRNQLAGLLDMAQHPMQYGNALLQAAMHPSQSLPAIGNALADQYRMATSGAAGFGQVLGENISPRGLLGVTAAAAKKPILREAVAYHGSPHNFDEFKLSKETIGTGEGAQAYGHGLYFAESPEVAGTYKNLTAQLVSGAQQRLKKFGGDVDATVADLSARAAKYRAGGEMKYADVLEEDIRTLQKYKQSGQWPSGKMYTVDIPDDAVGKMLDWDAPVSSQPAPIRDFLRRSGGVDLEAKAASAKFDEMELIAQNDSALYQRWNSGELSAIAQRVAQGKGTASDRSLINRLFREYADVYESRDFLSGLEKEKGVQVGDALQKAGIANNPAISEELKRLGFPGIKFYDAGSRTGGEGTRNFVVFDDKLVKVLKKD